MAGHDVAAELVADLQRAFEIDARAGLQPAAVVSRSASSQASTSNQRALEPPSGSADDGQADAGAGDRRADGDGLRIVGGVDPQPRALVERP